VSPPLTSPYETWYRQSVWDWEDGGRSQTRGYYWTNLMSDGHLARLGGRSDFVRATAEARLDYVPLGENAVLVRSPSPVGAFDDGQLARMKVLLQPVLRPGRYDYYVGPPLRIVRDPGTAFMTDSDPTRLPDFDD